MGDSRGSIACFATYRPPVPLDIYSCPADPPPSSRCDEVLLTDGKSYNHNCRAIPAAALRELLTFLARKNPKLAKEMLYTPDDAAKGVATGLVFVSERDNGLETLHVALRGGKRPPIVRRLADIYGAGTFGGARMEDSGCFAGGFLVSGRVVSRSIIYVSTKEPVSTRRSPWTVVYKTNLANGKTERLTPQGQYDMSPAVSPSGKMVAVANFQFNRWNGEIEHLKTDIVIMNVDRQAQGGLRRNIIIRDGGWPTWGSDKVIFFHRGIVGVGEDKKVNITWGVFQYNISTKAIVRVTPESFDAMTPAGINEIKVAVATIRQKSKQAAETAPRVEEQYRHIEIFDVTARDRPVELTRKAIPKADHYNPFVLDGGKRIGFHRCRTDEFVKSGSVIPKNFQKLQSPESHKEVGLFRLSGVFPTISTDGLKLAFVDNEFKAVWLADSNGLRVIYDYKGSNKIFSTVWNQNKKEDTLYICLGPAFNFREPLEIYAIFDASTTKTNVRKVSRLTGGNVNNAFPSSNPEGTKFVFRSTCDRPPGEDNPTKWKVGKREHKNLYIIENAKDGETGGSAVTRLTDGEWTDTHCSWSPQGDWIVFSSTRDKPKGAEALDNGLDPGYFGVYLVKATDKTVVRVIRSGASFAGHVNHPMFSPDMRSIVVTSDLAAVSAEPISLPIFVHSVRPYGDIFAVNLRVFDTNEDITQNEDIDEFHRITHSRYEYSTPTWTKFASVDPNSQWDMSKVITANGTPFSPKCPYMQGDGGESWHMAGHLTIGKRCC